MGHIVNPIAFRLYFSKFWNNNWYTNKFNYQYFFIKDLQLNEYFYSFFHLNKKNRIEFSNNMVYDSLSTFRKSNSYYITLNIFDYRLIDFSKAKRIYNIALHDYRIRKSFLKQYNRTNNRLIKHLNLKFLSYPWLYRLYINNYSKKLGNKLSFINVKNKKIYFYRKKIFLAYTLFFFKNLNQKLEIKFLLKSKLKDLINNILSNYLNFTLNLNIKKNINENLFSDINNYNKFLDQSKNLIEKKYINFFSIKRKNLNKIKIHNFNNKTKKYFFGIFNNVLTIKNLIIKYTNLLILLNKRINYFKLKYEDNFHILNFNNLYWKRERLLSLIYYLKSKSLKNKLFFQKKIINLKTEITAIEQQLKITSNINDRNILIKNHFVLLKNLYKYYKFIQIYNRITVIDKKFIFQSYLNILNNFNLLRFNYRFAMYKQAYYKHKKNLVKSNLTNVVKLKILLNLNKSNNIFLNKIVKSIININFNKNFRILNNNLENKIKDSISLKLKKNELIKFNNQKINYKNFLSFMHNYKGLNKVYSKSLNLLRKEKKNFYVINKNIKQISKLNKYKNNSKSWAFLSYINKNNSKVLQNKKWPYIKSKLFFMFKRHNPRSKFLLAKKIKNFNFILYKHKKYKNSRLYNNLIYKYTKKFYYLNKKYDKQFLNKYIFTKNQNKNKELILNSDTNVFNNNNTIFNLHKFNRISIDKFKNINQQSYNLNHISFINKKDYLYSSYKNSLLNSNVREYIYIKKSINNFNKFLILNKFNNKLNNIKPTALFIKRIIEKSEEQLKLELQEKKKKEDALLYKKKLSLKYFSLLKNRKIFFIFNKNKISKTYFLNSNYLKKYVNKLNLAKQFNLNIKKLTHADLNTWNKSSFFLYNNNKMLNFLNTNHNVDLLLFYNNKLKDYSILKKKFNYYNNQFKKIKYLTEYFRLNKFKDINLKFKFKNLLYLKNINQLKSLFSEIKNLKKEIEKFNLLFKKIKKYNINLFRNNYSKNENIDLSKIIQNKKIFYNNKIYNLITSANFIQKPKIRFVLNFYKFKKLETNNNNSYLIKNLNYLKNKTKFNKIFIFNKIKNKFIVNSLKFYKKSYKSKFFLKNNFINLKNKKYLKLFFLFQFHFFKNITKNKNYFYFKQKKIKPRINFLLKSRFNKKLYYTYYKSIANKFSFYNNLVFKNKRVKKNKKKFYKFFYFLIKKENSKFFLKHYNLNYKYSNFYFKNLYKIKKKDIFINYKMIPNSFYKQMFRKNKNVNKNYYFKLKNNLLNNYKNKIINYNFRKFKIKKNNINFLINKKLILNKLLFKLRKKKNLNWFFLLRNSSNLIKKKLKKKNFRLNFIKLLKNFKFSSIYIRKFLLNFNTNLFIKALDQVNLLNNKNNINSLNLNKKEYQYFFIRDKFNFLYKPLINKDLQYKDNSYRNVSKFNFKSIKLSVILLYESLLKKHKNYYLSLKNNLRQNIFIFKYKKYYWTKALLKEKNQNNNNNSDLILSDNLSEIKKAPQNLEEYDNQLISNIYKDFLKIFNIYSYKYRNINKKKSRFLCMVNYRLIGSYYYYISLFFKWHLTRNFLKNQINNIFIRFNLMLEPSAFILSRYICENLKRKLSLNKIVMSLLYDIPRTFPNIEAIQIKCTGRYSRRQRANKNWYRFGNIRTADINRIIEYASTGVVLRYGYTNIKVWFLKKKQSPSISTSFV